MANDTISEFGDASSGLLRSPVSLPRLITPLSRWQLIALLQVCEAVAVIVSCRVWLAGLALNGGQRVGLMELLTCGLTVAIVVHFVLRALGAYDFLEILDTARSCATAALGWVLASSGLLFWASKLATQDQAWRISLFGWFIGGLLIVLVRLAIARTGNALLKATWLNHNVAVIGIGREAQQCALLLHSERGGSHVADFVALPSELSSAFDTDRVSRPIAELQRLIDRHQVRDVIVAIEQHERPLLPELVRGLIGLPVRVLLWPSSCGVEGEWFRHSDFKIGGEPLLLAGAPPLDGWRWVLKDGRDRMLAALLLVFLLPILLVIAAAIRLSTRGPILFRQEREGYNGRRFTIYKFRTMRVGQQFDGALQLTRRNDPRLFPVGALLRRTSLDELPQLLNVLRGDMWLVGPRPHSPLATAAGQHYAVAVKEYMSRFRVKPGITGWAQVNGWRGPTETLEQIQQRVAHDCYYIEHLSVWLDLRILARTAISGFVHSNAF